MMPYARLIVSARRALSTIVVKGRELEERWATMRESLPSESQAQSTNDTELIGRSPEHRNIESATIERDKRSNTAA